MTKLKFHPRAFLLLIMCIAALDFAGCKSKSVFLEPVRTSLDEAEIALRAIQFYNDKNIIMRRKFVETPDMTEDQGRLIEVDGEQLQEIVIKKGTPGVVSSIENGKLLIRFELGEGKTLRFYKNSKGAYQVDADRWVAKKGLINYSGLDFLIEPESNDVLLMYREKKRFESSSELRTAKGLKVHK